ncbi:protein of unknown function [Cupriavidus taiwanensis]|nr:protein of unknown function [Cupriavidus taiwanensis]
MPVRFAKKALQESSKIVFDFLRSSNTDYPTSEMEATCPLKRFSLQWNRMMVTGNSRSNARATTRPHRASYRMASGEGCVSSISQSIAGT